MGDINSEFNGICDLVWKVRLVEENKILMAEVNVRCICSLKICYDTCRDSCFLCCYCCFYHVFKKITPERERERGV